MDLVSVIIPTHNRETDVLNAVNSVYNQTYKNIEIIVVVDGSEDNTVNMIKEKKYPNINIKILKESKGANYARNYGAKFAKGKYIAFLDDDDIWAKTKIEKQILKFQDSYKIGLVYTGRKIYYPDYNIEYYAEPRRMEDLSKDILFNNYIGGTSSPLIKRHIFEKVKGFDIEFPARQDYDLWIRICQETMIEFVNEPLVQYFNYSDSQQISDNVQKAKKATKIINYKYHDLFKKLTSEELETIEINNLKNFAKRYQKNDEKKRARKLYIKIFKKKKNINNFILIFTTFFEYKTLLKIKAKFNYNNIN